MPNTQFGTKEKYSEQDVIFKGDIIEQARSNFVKSGKIQYHQKGNSCFLYGPMGAVSDLTGCEFSQEDQDLLISNAWASKRADPKWGGYFWYGVKTVIDLYNEKYAKKGEWLESERFNMKEYAQDFIDKNYSIIIGYKNTKKLVQDKRDDGILNFSGGEYTGEDKGVGHCTRMTEIKEENKIINNYDGYSHNIFGIDDYEKQIDNGMFFENGYVLLIKDGTRDGTEGFSLKQNEEYLKNRKEAIAKRKEIEIAEAKFT